MSLPAAALALALAAVAPSAAATHISKPVLTMESRSYAPGETLAVRGWAEYEGKPASGVLLEIRLLAPSGAELLRGEVRSDAAGNFRLDHRLGAATPAGEYALEVTSHCNDAHRHLCTRQKSALGITVKPGAN